MNQTTPFPTAVRRELSRNTDLYAPLRVLSVALEPQKERDRSERQIDGIVQLGWNNRKETFVTELKARSAPKVVQEGIRILKEFSANGKNRLLILPYLSSAVIDLIKPEGISGLDLNGNYFIQTKDLLAIRLDQPNLYKESQTIKQAFSGNSSIVGRFLLLENKTYSSVNEIFNGIRELGGIGGDDPISLPTVSKVLKRLEEEIILEKTRDKIRLLQPGKLLDRLRDEYRSPKITEERKFKLSEEMKPWKLGLTGMSIFSGKSSAQRYIFAGGSSGQRYATTTAPEVYSMYVTDIQYQIRISEIAKYEENRFPNLILKETRDAFVYFADGRVTAGWASPVQTYLELSQLDKREKEIAEDVRKMILEPFK